MRADLRLVIVENFTASQNLTFRRALQRLDADAFDELAGALGAAGHDLVTRREPWLERKGPGHPGAQSRED
jgi:hypothetical protein